MALKPSTEETRDFDLGTVLTVTTGRLFAPISSLCEILEYMSDGPVWTHALPTVGRAMAPVLVDRHPWLADVEVPEGIDSEEKARSFVDTLAQQYGDLVEVPKAPEVYRDPETPVDVITELVDTIDRVRGGKPL